MSSEDEPGPDATAPAKGDRGPGIHVHGDFRISNFRLSFDKVTGDLIPEPLTTQMRIDIFDHWLKIAELASCDAEAARRTGLEVPRGEGQRFHQVLEQEFRTSMVAVAASAIALDAFYASVVELAPDTRIEADSRDASIFETLKRGFALKGKQWSTARDPVQKIFRLRDQAVHPPAAWAEPIQHPVYKLGMEPRFVHFRAENAINAQWFARNLIALCVRNPKAQHERLSTWAQALVERAPVPPPRPEWESGRETSIE